MELIIAYIVLAILVAFMATIDLFRPVISKLDESTTYIITLYVTLFILALLMAPVLVYPCISSLKGVEFRDALLESLISKN